MWTPEELARDNDSSYHKWALDHGLTPEQIAANDRSWGIIGPVGPTTLDIDMDVAALLAALRQEWLDRTDH